MIKILANCSLFLLLALVLPNNATANDQAQETKLVQSNIKALVNATYDGDIETIINHTHDKIIELGGGVDSLRKVLKQTLAQFAAAGMSLENLTFPQDPTFIDGTENQFAIVPTRSIISGNNKKIESIHFQLGARKLKEKSAWKYVDGGKLNSTNIKQLFSDFPANSSLPKVSMKLIDADK